MLDRLVRSAECTSAFDKRQTLPNLVHCSYHRLLQQKSEHIEVAAKSSAVPTLLCLPARQWKTAMHTSACADFETWVMATIGYGLPNSVNQT